MQIPQSRRHRLNRPNDAAEYQVRVEDAQCDLSRILLGFAHCRNDEADGRPANALQHGQQEYPDNRTFCWHLQR